METRTYNVYTFQEASDKLKEKILEKYRQSKYEHGFVYASEYIDSLNAFVKSTGIQLRDYCLGSGASYTGIQWSYESYNWDFDVDSISGLKLRTWLLNNWVCNWEKGKYYHSNSTNSKGLYRWRRSKIQKTIECPFTGCCYDHDLIQPILDFIKKPNNHTTLRCIIDECFDNFITAYNEDEECQYSDDAIIETIYMNEYMFKENGEID